MCGINGFLSNNFKETEIIDGILDKMNHEIIHRGTDQDGFFIENNKGFSIGMAMRRLSIIDLSTGKQPIFSADKQIVIVFNGEIYNYKQLKKEHLGEYDFITNSDTEVIVALYQKYGTDSFSLLNGMFAFSIYDKTVNKLFIARDFFGEKPLYYALKDDAFYWCSELKSILNGLDLLEVSITLAKLFISIGLTFLGLMVMVSSVIALFISPSYSFDLPPSTSLGFTSIL